MFQDDTVQSHITSIISDSFSDSALEKWELFMEENSMLFSDVNEEYSHKHYEIYNEFIELIEGRLEKMCNSCDIELSDFFDECKQYKDVPAIDVFNSLIILTTEFRAFTDVMSDVNKRRYLFNGIKQWKNYLSISNKRK
jgi:hypothetical protein